jgi:ketosteroid isomerase-like protein
MPFVGRDAVLAAPRTAGPRTCSIIHTEIAPSGDLGITIGGFDDSARAASGTFVRVWKKDVTGRWRIVFQTEADRNTTGR